MVYIIEFQKGGCIHNGDIKLSKKKRVENYRSVDLAIDIVEKAGIHY